MPEGYRHYSVIEGITTGAFGAMAIVSPLVGPRKSGPSGGNWFDDAVRTRLRAKTFSRRLLAQYASDVTLGLVVTHGLFFDPFVNASWLRESPDVGLQMGLVNLEVFAITLGIQQFVANRVGRERPYGDSCRSDELYQDTHTCHARDRYRSFFSGHTAISFSLAATTCVHHQKLPLSFHSPVLTCGIGFVLAAFTGTMRIVSDNHYATDVITGALVGTGIGALVPLLHYASPVSRLGVGNSDLSFWVVPSSRGVSVGGTF